MTEQKKKNSLVERQRKNIKSNRTFFNSIPNIPDPRHDVFPAVIISAVVGVGENAEKYTRSTCTNANKMPF